MPEQPATEADRILTLPNRALVNLNTGIVRLEFPANSIAPTGHYQVAGGICWPMLLSDNVFKGCAVIAARDVLTGTLYVFDQREFSCVDHVLRPDGGILTEGLAPWFVRNWATLYAYRYYWFQADEYERTFRLRVHRCATILPKPALIPTYWKDDSHAALIISDLLEQRRLKMRKGPVTMEISQYQADPKRGPFPAMHALACLLTGISQKRLPDQHELFEPTIA